MEIFFTEAMFLHTTFLVFLGKMSHYRNLVKFLSNLSFVFFLVQYFEFLYRQAVRRSVFSDALYFGETSNNFHLQHALQFANFISTAIDPCKLPLVQCKQIWHERNHYYNSFITIFSSFSISFHLFSFSSQREKKILQRSFLIQQPKFFLQKNVFLLSSPLFRAVLCIRIRHSDQYINLNGIYNFIHITYFVKHLKQNNSEHNAQYTYPPT